MRLLFIVGLILTQSAVYAGVEYRQFDNAETQRVYKDLVTELRCLVCQNQNIADSNADLAKDLRRQVYEMLQQGKTRQDVVNFMVQRYGDFVLYRPPFYSKTLVLWLGPVIFVMVGLIALWFLASRKKVSTEMHLSADKKAKIDALLDEGKDS